MRYVKRPGGFPYLACYCEVGEPTPIITVADGGLSRPEVYQKRTWHPGIKNLREEIIANPPFAEEQILAGSIRDESKARMPKADGLSDAFLGSRIRTHYRNTGWCANPKCRKFFDVHSNLPLTCWIGSIYLQSGVTIHSPHVRFVNRWQPTATGRLWIDWIPSPRGPQRLFLSKDKEEEEKSVFIGWAQHAVQVGVSLSEFPHWRTDGTEEEFSRWATPLIDATNERWEQILGQHVNSHPTLQDFKVLERFTETLKPQIIRECKSRTDAVHRLFEQAA